MRPDIVWIRAEDHDQYDDASLWPGERAGHYTDDYSGGPGLAEVDAVEELVDRGGGWAFNGDGEAYKFVAPLPR